MLFEQLDFHSVFLEEGKDFYQCLRRIEKHEFNYWVSHNFISVGVMNSFEDVKPNPLIIALSEQSGYKHIDAQCHYSAKAICILMPEFEYYTGFIKRKESYKPIITHSFNVFKNQIVDFTKHITDPFNKSDSKSYPHEYFGVRIPREFVLNFRDEILNEHSMNPLICEWYQHSAM